MLSAKKILEQMRGKKLSKYDATSLLISLIENCEHIKDRVEYIEVFEKVSPKNEFSFKFLENIFLSDMQPRVRCAAFKVLYRNYLEKVIPTLKWVVKNENQHRWHSIIFKTIIDELKHSEIIELKEIRASIIDFLEKSYGLKYEDLMLLLELRIMLGVKGGGSRLTNASPKDGRLTGLTLYGRNLEKIPKIICSFSKLKYLDLRQNKLTKIPSWICQFRDLESLSLGGNLITSLPECILNHEKLERIDLYTSDVPKLRTIPNDILKFAKHKTAKRYLKHGVIPNEAYVLGLLEILGLVSFSKLSPYVIRWYQEYEYSNFKLDKRGHITSLSMVGYEDSCVNLIPEQIGELKYLEELNLTHNFFRELPESIGSFESLKKLDLFFNRIEKLPESIGMLKSLKYLDLSDNKLQILPESIGSLESLEELNLYGNNIVKLPESIGRLRSLKNLNVESNKLQELPESLFTLTALYDIRLHDNKFSDSYFENCKRRLSKK